MGYQIIDLEITQPLPVLSLPERCAGIALLVRKRGKPIAFLMKDSPSPAELSPEGLAALLNNNIAEKMLQEAIRDELAPPSKRSRFPPLTVAICTKDRPENLARCLKHLSALQTLDTSSPFEILVVDNGSADPGTRRMVEASPKARYVLEPRPGLDFARNRAIKEATGGLLAFLDDDVVVDHGWLQGLVEAWSENPDAACFTGLVLPYELATEAQITFERGGGFRRGFDKICYGPALPYSPFGKRPWDRVYPCGSGIFGAGCNMAFRRDVLLELGGFDEALDTGTPLPGGGDLDIFYRVIMAGYCIVYEPRYLVFHQHRRELEKLRRQYWSWGLGVMALVFKGYRNYPSQRRKYALLVTWWGKDKLGRLLRSLMRPHDLPPAMILAELWGGLVGLLGEYPRSQRRVQKIREDH